MATTTQTHARVIQVELLLNNTRFNSFWRSKTERFVKRHLVQPNKSSSLDSVDSFDSMPRVVVTVYRVLFDHDDESDNILQIKQGQTLTQVPGWSPNWPGWILMRNFSFHFILDLNFSFFFFAKFSRRLKHHNSGPFFRKSRKNGNRYDFDEVFKT